MHTVQMRHKSFMEEMDDVEKLQDKCLEDAAAEAFGKRPGGKGTRKRCRLCGKYGHKANTCTEEPDYEYQKALLKRKRKEPKPKTEEEKAEEAKQKQKDAAKDAKEAKRKDKKGKKKEEASEHVQQEDKDPKPRQSPRRHPARSESSGVLVHISTTLHA